MGIAGKLGATATATVVALWLAPSAGAITTVSYSAVTGPAGGLRVTTDADERNEITFDYRFENGQQVFRVTDARQFVAVPTGCSGGGQGGTASCIADGQLVVGVDLGAGDDSLTITAGGTRSNTPMPITAQFILGLGNDVYTNTGGPRDSEILVAAVGGRDALIAGPGREFLNGSDGDDAFVLSNDGLAPDFVVGGPGFDRVTFFSTERLEITLDGLANDGEPGEADNVLQMEEVSIVNRAVAGGEVGAAGGRIVGDDNRNKLSADGRGPFALDGRGGNDELAGSAGDDDLRGGQGNDLLNGLNGRDRLLGGVGDDRLDGGPDADTLQGDAGSDTINSRDGVRDRVFCDSRLPFGVSQARPGFDIALIDLVDASPRNCERVERANRFERPNVQIGGRRLELSGGGVRSRLVCPRAARRTCRGSLHSAALTRRDRTIGSGPATSFRVPPGRSRSVRVAVTAAARAALAADRTTQLQLTSVERGRHGPKTTTLTVAADG